jgi:hypothetical protein
MVPRLLTRSWHRVRLRRWSIAEQLETYSLGHTDTGIPNRKGLVLLVGNDVDAQVLAGVQLAGIRERLIADLVERIRGIGDKFSEEDLLVGVDGVDDQREQLRDLSLELESLRHLDCM